jgi:hypothetical protein
MDVVWKDRILPHTTFRRLPGATAVEDDKTQDARRVCGRDRSQCRHSSAGH